MTTILFMGGEMPSFLPSSSGPLEVTGYGTAVFAHDPLFARCSILCSGTTDNIKTPVLPSQTTFWTHFNLTPGNGASSGDMTGYQAQWLNSAGTAVVRLAHNTVGLGPSTNTVDLEYWNGSAWVGSGAPAGTSQPTYGTQFDVRITCNTTSGRLQLYQGGTKVIDYAPNLSGITDIAQVMFIGGNIYSAGVPSGFTGSAYVSEVVCSTATTVGYRLLTRYPTGNSATNTAWTGDYTGVDEAVYSDADEISSSTTGQVETYTNSGPTVNPALYVKAIGVYTRAKNNGSTNLQHCVRSSGSNYFGSTQSLAVGFAPFGTIWEIDPATSLPWALSQVDAVETGVKAI
jgi:hypothetical protein